MKGQADFSAYREAVAFAFLILLLRPQGLLGARLVQKVEADRHDIKNG